MTCGRLRFLFAAWNCAAALVTGLCAAQTPAPEPQASAPPAASPPFVDLPGVRDEKFALLTEAVFQQTALDFPDELYSSQNQGAPWPEWKFDNYQIKGDVERVILRFEHQGPLPPDSHQAGSFVASVQFEEYRPLGERMSTDPEMKKGTMWDKKDGIVIRHNLPKKAAEAGGVRVVSNARRPYRILVEGRDQTGLVALVPQSKVRGMRGLILCPRDYDLWKLRAGSRMLADTGYVLAGVEAEVSGSAQAKVNSGFGPGVARASVQVTPNVAPSREVEDESRAVYPFASVTYVPQVVERAAPPPLFKERASAGVQLRTVLHNSLGHKTESTGTVVMTVREVKIPKGFAMRHEIGGQELQFTVAPGLCYAVLKESKLEHRFVKEPLPEELRRKEKEAQPLKGIEP